MAAIEVQVPDIGDFDEVSVIEVLVKAGDTVKAEQSLITVESDKASMEIPSSASGVVKELRVKVGDKVKQGSVLLVLEGAASESATESEVSSPSPGQGRVGAPATAAAASNAPAASTAAVPPPQPSPSGGGSNATTTELRIPDIGDFKDVAVIEILVKPGDTIKAEQSLITVESDKASMEIPASASGVLKTLTVKIGDKVNIGDPIGSVESAAGVSPPPPGEGRVGAPPTAAAASGNTAATTAMPPPQPFPGGGGSADRTPPTAALPPHEPTTPTGTLPHASPSVRKFARELGVPLDEVKGTGPKARITPEDVQSFTRSVMTGDTTTKAASAKAPASTGGAGSELGLLPWPKVDFAKFGPFERKEMGRIKKISGANLHRNWVMIPHVTNHDDADITELEAFRVQLNKENEKAGVKVTMLAFLIKACVAALKKFPNFNSSLDGDTLVMKQYFHIGFAADTPNGLVVPVIKNADQKGILQINSEMGELAKKAREGKLGPAEMQGACFTISSLGGIGGRYFTPIINAPEVAILGVCKSQMEPVWDGKAFQPRLMLPLSLSWDHRVIDGASAARFNAYLGAILSDFRRTML